MRLDYRLSGPRDCAPGRLVANLILEISMPLGIPGQASGAPLSALDARSGPDADSCAAANHGLFDHVVGELLKLQRYINPERLCGLKIYYEIEFDRLFDRQICGRGSAENLVDIDRRPPVKVI